MDLSTFRDRVLELERVHPQNAAVGHASDNAQVKGLTAHGTPHASQREHNDPGKGFDVDVAVGRHADEKSVVDGDQGQGDDVDGTGADVPTRRPAAMAPMMRARAGAGRTGRSPAKVLQILRTEK
jgi:hypothetical protein